MEPEQLRIAAQAAGPVRTEQLMGREFRVFPAVLVREQVLNNNLGQTFLPREEIEASVDAWNGIPVVIRHPTKRGQPVSARDPEVLNARGTGFLFRARCEDGALKADVYLDSARAAAIQDGPAVFNRAVNGEVGELSTGFGTRLEAATGTFDGRPYEVILRDIRPDHLALLVEETGACSVADGCGLGVNCEGGDGCNCQDEAPGALRQALDRATALLRRIGLWPAATNESDEDRRRLLHSALREQFGGDDVHTWIEAVFSDEGFLVFERESDDAVELLRVDFEITEAGEVSFSEPVEVRRVTTFEPVANAGAPNPEEGSTMKRDQMIAHLAEAGPLDADALGKLSDAQLQALCAAQADNAEAGSEPTAADSAAATALLEEIRAEMAELRAATAPAVEEQARERESLVAELAANERCPFEEEELKAKGLAELRKLRSMARGENYAGRGGPRGTSTNAEPQYAEPVPYWKIDSDAKEG